MCLLEFDRHILTDSLSYSYVPCFCFRLFVLILVVTHTLNVCNVLVPLAALKAFTPKPVHMFILRWTKLATLATRKQPELVVGARGAKP